MCYYCVYAACVHCAVYKAMRACMHVLHQRHTGAHQCTITMQTNNAHQQQRKQTAHGARLQVQFIRGSILDAPNLELGTFDFIRCTGVLHHIEDPYAGLAALSQVSLAAHSVDCSFVLTAFVILYVLLYVSHCLCLTVCVCLTVSLALSLTGRVCSC